MMMNIANPAEAFWLSFLPNDERNEAVTRTIAHVITAAHAAGRKIGICGQAPI